ncbi:DUF58 domain-containing protein [Candidatus Woesearchaeota archaeon]|nr:DUF58 domain-containing protein [Candidatus Woesearchaeota archaeon]
MRRLKISTDVAVKRLLISTKGLVTTRFLGNYQSVFRGRGLEFDSFRTYTPDDDSNLIDWKTSARASQLLVKNYVEERNLTVFFLVDVSSSMILGSIDKLKSEYAAELATTLAYVVLTAGDSIGFAMFTDRPVYQRSPGNGIKEYHKMTETLINSDYYGGNFSFTEATKFLLSYLEERAIVIIISDFLPMQESMTSDIQVLSKKFDLIGLMVRDELDFDLPKGMGLVHVKDPFSDKTMLIEPNAVADAYHQQAVQEAQQVGRMFTGSGANFLQLITSKPFFTPVAELFRMRAAKWR